MSQSVSQSVGQSVSQSVRQPASQPASQSVSQSVSHEKILQDNKLDIAFNSLKYNKSLGFNEILASVLKCLPPVFVTLLNV